MEILVGISKYRLTGVTGTASAFRVLIELENTSKLQFDSVRYTMIGGTYYGQKLTKMVESKFHNAKIINIYGCSVTINSSAFMCLKFSLESIFF